VKQHNLEVERKDGTQRHFRYDWQEVAKYNPQYLAYVEGERARLGEDHPLFLTQYRLLPLRGGNRFLSPLQRAQLQGAHARRRTPEPGKVYIAGIDIAGEAESAAGDLLLAVKPRQDSTVITIGEVGTENHPVLRVVEHYAWTGRRHAELYPQMVDILKNIWRCRRVVIDATGIGQPVYSFLKDALGNKITPFVFTAPSKSELGFNLLAAVNSGRLRMYAGDGSPEYRRFWREMELAKSNYRAERTLNFFVEASAGHDDFLMSMALTVEAAEQSGPRSAKGSLPV